MENFNILSKEEVFLKGIEFADDICFSGKYGKEVFDKPMEDGGKSITGLLYERYKNGSLAYYSYYKNGVPAGDYVKFYENGKVKSFQRMVKSVISGKSTSWFENGNVKSIAEYKYGYTISYKEWNINGEIITEKLEPDEFEKSMIDKYNAWAVKEGE